MNRVRASLIASTLLLSLAVASCATTTSDNDNNTTTDQNVDSFGVPYIEPTAVNGMSWVSNWKEPRAFDGVDPKDPWFDANHGSAEYAVRDNELHITGQTPRMYVHDPDLRRQWRDVEVTAYFKRIKDANVPYAGMTAVVRANHGVTGDETQDLCDTRGYGARLRYDGRSDFEKETSHPRNSAISEKVVWKNGMPYNRWIGYKYIAYDLPGKRVKLMVYIDEKNNGRWRLVNQVIDAGKTWGEVPCAKGINPKMILSKSPSRAGSESRKPNLSVYFRSDGVSSNGLVYKSMSVREITAPKS